MNFQIILVILLLSQQYVFSQKVNTKDKSLTERIEWADKKKTAFGSTQFYEQLEGCYTQFNDAKSNIADEDRDTVYNAIGLYQYCTEGATDNQVYKNFMIATPKTTQDVQLAVCQYFEEDIDGADQLDLYFGAKKCFIDTETTLKAQGYDEVNNDCYQYQSGLLVASEDDTEIESVVQLYTCIEQAVYYLQPYTERQFYNCENECLAENASDEVDSTLNLEGVIIDDGYTSCIQSREQCGRFNTLHSSGATDPKYATHYKACYDTCWTKAESDSVVAKYFDCLGSCKMPDYSSEAVDANSMVLQISLMLISMVLFTVI